MAKTGDAAPNFKLLNQDNQSIQLRDVLQQQPLVLVFFPRAGSPVCTKQLCGIQQSYENFAKFGVRILGVSPDSPEANREFRAAYRYTFDLLSDPARGAFKAYGVGSLLLPGMTGRGTFVVGKDGKILYHKVEMTPLTFRDAGEMLEVLKKLRPA